MCANPCTLHAYPPSPLQPLHRSTILFQASQKLYDPCSKNITAVI